MKLPFKGALYIEISSIFDGLRIYPAVLTNKNVETYWFFQFAFLILIVLYILMLIYIDFSFKIKKLYF